VGDVLKAAQTATDLTDKLIGYTVRAGISASVNQAVYGKQAGSFGQAFVNSFVASGAADAANWVGGHTDAQSAQNLAAHALIGCAAAVATGGHCGAGAVGGATSALISPLLIDAMTGDDASARFNGLTLSQQAAVAALSTFAGGVAAQTMGLDAVTAAQAARNEAINNALRHSTELAKLRQRCKGSAEGGCGLVRRLDGTQAVVEGMPVKGPWQIVAHVDETGRPVAYSAYNIETRQTDFVMDPQDVRALLAGNTIVLQASSGASYLAASMPAYQQRASEGAFQAATGLAGGDFSQARQGLGTVLDSLGEAVQDPGWWLTAGMAVMGGGLARVGNGGKQILNLRSVPAEQVNASFTELGLNPPYLTAVRPREFTTASDLEFLRVHGPTNQEGVWMVRAGEIEGMSAAEIQTHLGLKYAPTHVSPVLVLRGADMRVGRVGPQPQWGAPSPQGIQYELLDLSKARFGQPRPLQ
jgi:hypothetical protein